MLRFYKGFGQRIINLWRYLARKKFSQKTGNCKLILLKTIRKICRFFDEVLMKNKHRSQIIQNYPKTLQKVFLWQYGSVFRVPNPELPDEAFPISG